MNRLILSGSWGQIDLEQRETLCGQAVAGHFALNVITTSQQPPRNLLHREILEGTQLEGLCAVIGRVAYATGRLVDRVEVPTSLYQQLKCQLDARETLNPPPPAGPSETEVSIPMWLFDGLQRIMGSGAYSEEQFQKRIDELEERKPLANTQFDLLAKGLERRGGIIDYGREWEIVADPGSLCLFFQKKGTVESIRFRVPFEVIASTSSLRGVFRRDEAREQRVWDDTAKRLVDHSAKMKVKLREAGPSAVARARHPRDEEPIAHLDVDLLCDDE